MRSASLAVVDRSWVPICSGLGPEPGTRRSLAFSPLSRTSNLPMDAVEMPAWRLAALICEDGEDL